MIKNIKGLKVSHSVDRYINEVLLGEEYKFVSYYPTIVDVGANIGTFSLYMYDNADRIYSIEPVESNINELRKTIELNNLTKIVPLQMAISDVNMVRNMIESGDPALGGWSLSEIGEIPVDTRTIDNIMETQGIDYIDLLKIDVEGEEVKIIQSKNFPYKQIGTIVGEYHSVINNEELKKTLEWLGYRYFDLGNNHFLART